MAESTTNNISTSYGDMEVNYKINPVDTNLSKNTKAFIQQIEELNAKMEEFTEMMGISIRHTGNIPKKFP